MSRIIYLYIKTHNKTGLKYLGKTIKPDPHKYKGSGVYWLRHIKKYGYDVDTKIIYQTNNPQEFEKTALYYSELYNIIESKEWANMSVENGKGGILYGKYNGMYGKTHTKKIREFLAIKATQRFKNKTYEELYGEDKAKILKKMRSEKFKTINRKADNNARFDKNEYLFYNTKLQEFFLGDRYSFYNKYDLTKSQVCLLVNKKIHQYRDWILVNY